MNIPLLPSIIVSFLWQQIPPSFYVYFSMNRPLFHIGHYLNSYHDPVLNKGKPERIGIFFILPMVVEIDRKNFLPRIILAFSLDVLF